MLLFSDMYDMGGLQYGTTVDYFMKNNALYNNEIGKQQWKGLCIYLTEWNFYDSLKTDDWILQTGNTNLGKMIF